MNHGLKALVAFIKTLFLPFLLGVAAHTSTHYLDLFDNPFNVSTKGIS